MGLVVSPLPIPTIRPLWLSSSSRFVPYSHPFSYWNVNQLFNNSLNILKWRWHLLTSPPPYGITYLIPSTQSNPNINIWLDFRMEFRSIHPYRSPQHSDFFWLPHPFHPHYQIRASPVWWWIGLINLTYYILILNHLLWLTILLL